MVVNPKILDFSPLSKFLVSTSGVKWITITVRDRDQCPAPDLVERNFVAPGPNRVDAALPPLNEREPIERGERT